VGGKRQMLDLQQTCMKNNDKYCLMERHASITILLYLLKLILEQSTTHDIMQVTAMREITTLATLAK